MASYEPTLDIRTPAQEQRRARTRSRKYNSFRDVKPGQVNQPHMRRDERITVTFGEGENKWTYTSDLPALPENAKIETVSKRMLWKEAQRLGPQDRDRCEREWHSRGRRLAQRALKRGTTVENGNEEYWDQWFDDKYRLDCGYNSDEEEQWEWNVMWAGLDNAIENEWGVHGETYADMYGLVEKAEDTWDAKRWRAVEREWSKVHEREVDDERLVVLGGRELDWGFADDWEEVET